MKASQLDTLRQLAASFRSAIVEARNLASLSPDDMARLARQLAVIEQRMPAFAAPPA